MYVHPSRTSAGSTHSKQPKISKKSEQSSSDGHAGRYIAGFVIGFILLVPTLLIAHSHHLTGLQARIFYDFDNLPNSYRVPALIITEGLGSAIPIVLCIGIPALLKRFRLAWLFAFTVGGAAVVMEVAKQLTKEPRPVIMLQGHLHERAIETGSGFPSGHETVATAMALTLWLVLPRKWRWLSIVWILIVAISRLYLGVHTPADIVGGFAIGLMAVCFVQLLPQSITKPLRLSKGSELTEKGW